MGQNDDGGTSAQKGPRNTVWTHQSHVGMTRGSGMVPGMFCARLTGESTCELLLFSKLRMVAPHFKD